MCVCVRDRERETETGEEMEINRRESERERERDCRCVYMMEGIRNEKAPPPSHSPATMVTRRSSGLGFILYVRFATLVKSYPARA